mgnify:CR=1 FL=1
METFLKQFAARDTTMEITVNDGTGKTTAVREWTNRFKTAYTVTVTYPDGTTDTSEVIEK